MNPAAEVGKIAKARGIPYLLDACQAAGQMRIDVVELNYDFLSATGRKYFRGPSGTGLLHVKEKWLKTLEPAMVDHFGAPWVALDRYKLRDDALRFETWENSYALRAGLGAAVDYADKIGIDPIQEHVSFLAETTRLLLSMLPDVELRDIGQTQCGIASFSINDRDPKWIVTQMAEAGFAIGALAPSRLRSR